jgi:hypothetical protein
LGWRRSYPEFTSLLALALAGLVRLDEGHASVTHAILRVDGQQWRVPELLRIKGEILLGRNSEPALTSRCLDQVAAIRRDQDAPCQEFGIGLNQRRLKAMRERGGEAPQQRASLHDWFTKGFDTLDLIAAQRLSRASHDAGRD